MKFVVGFGLVATVAFLLGAAWQFDFSSAKNHAQTQPPEKALPILPPSQKEAIAPPTDPAPPVSSVQLRAIEHYHKVIQLGVAERLAQQRIHAEALKQRAALAAAKKKAQDLARKEEEKRQIEREKVQRQLILATTKAQEAQKELAHERAQQAAMETQWLMNEERRRREEIAFQRTRDEQRKSDLKRQQLLNLHAEHQLISTIQSRKARASQSAPCPHKSKELTKRGSTKPSTRKNSQRHQASRSCPPPQKTNTHQPPSKGAQQSQHTQAVKDYRETFQKQAQEQKERIRNVWKK